MKRNPIPLCLATLLIIGYSVFLGTNVSFADTVKLPETGQEICYDSAGNVIACEGTRQDGDIRAGVPWPTPRFADNDDGTITDNLTGLMWLKDANCFGTKTWYEALDAMVEFNTNPESYSCAGYTASYDAVSYTHLTLPTN